MSVELAGNPSDHRQPESSGQSSERSKLRTLTGIQVLGTGSYAPPQEVTNDDLSRLGFDPHWILQRTGIQARRRLPPGQATSDMACIAAERCLAQAGVERESIDLVLLATMTPDRPAPSTASLIQHRLGLRAAAMDMNAACAGFMYALSTAAQFVHTGYARHALVVGADTNTRIVNPADLKTFPLFGDGAGAVLLAGGQPEQGLLAYTLGSDGEGAELLTIPGGGSLAPLTAESLRWGQQYVQMEGRSVFKWAVRLLTDTIRDVLRFANLSREDIRLFILHQANLRIMEAAAADLDLPRERLWINLDRYGNTSAASIPLALDEAHQAGRIERGDKILLCGFGAGLSWGTAVVQW